MQGDLGTRILCQSAFPARIWVTVKHSNSRLTHGRNFRWSQLPCDNSATSVTWRQWVQKQSYLLQNSHTHKLNIIGANPLANTEHLFFSAGKVCMTSPLSSYLSNLWDLGLILFFVWRPCTQLLGLQCVWWGFPWPGLFSLIYSPGKTWLCGKSTVGDQSILVNMYVPNLIHEPIRLIHKVEQRYFTGSDQTKNFCHFKLENRITYIYSKSWWAWEEVFCSHSGLLFGVKAL